MSKYKASDVANFLIYLTSTFCDDMTNMKLNKLLYYAQGHYLQKYGEPLFSDKIYAWEHGPVVKNVYTIYSNYKSDPICQYDAKAIDVITNADKVFLLNIAREYCRYTASALRSMTHTPKSPWDQTQKDAEIKTNLIKEYFKLSEKQIDPLNIHFNDEDFVGSRDKEGVLVLPKELADE